MKTNYSITALLLAMLLVGCNTNNPDNPDNGENNGDNNSGTTTQSLGFTIDANGHQVKFAKGNLQYNAALGTHQTAIGTAQGTWRFAENPWDFVGDSYEVYDDDDNSYTVEYGTVYNNGVKCNNSLASETYDGWIDRFDWATSGFDNTANNPYAINFQPWIKSIKELTAINLYGLGPSANMTDRSMTGTSANYDWGVFNAISNGGNQAGQWRTLQEYEWQYLMYKRKNAWHLYGPATINDVHCYVILPDNWKTPDGLTFLSDYDLHEMENAQTGAESYKHLRQWDSNVYTAEQWSEMDKAGAVCLPGDKGSYWTATADPDETSSAEDAGVI